MMNRRSKSLTKKRFRRRSVVLVVLTVASGMWFCWSARSALQHTAVSHNSASKAEVSIDTSAAKRRSRSVDASLSDAEYRRKLLRLDSQAITARNRQREHQRAVSLPSGQRNMAQRMAEGWVQAIQSAGVRKDQGDRRSVAADARDQLQRLRDGEH